MSNKSQSLWKMLWTGNRTIYTMRIFRSFLRLSIDDLTGKVCRNFLISDGSQRNSRITIQFEGDKIYQKILRQFFHLLLKVINQLVTLARELLKYLIFLLHYSRAEVSEESLKSREPE